MSAYFFVDVLEVTDPDKLARYRERVLATVERHGGRYLTVGGRVDPVEGDWQPAFPVMIEFPSLEQGRRWYDSDEYRPLKALRLAAMKGNAFFVEGTPFRASEPKRAAEGAAA